MKKLLCAILATILLLGGCTAANTPGGGTTGEDATSAPTNGSTTIAPTSGDTTLAPTSGDTTLAPTSGETTAAPTVGESSTVPTTDPSATEPEPSQFYEGYFDDARQDITVKCVSGTPNAYTIEGNVLTFTSVSENSVYSLSGQLRGSIVIDVGDDYEFELELQELTLISDDINPITVLSGDEVSLTAKKGTQNYIYDMRPAIDENDDSVYSGAIHAKTDLKIGGKGSLTVVSENNNGIHTKDDLKVKNLTLTVSCIDNALKGNDSVKITDATLTLIARQGDGIKTKNSDLSSKGKQRGSVSIASSDILIYAACDGIDAAYDVLIEDDATTLEIYTDRYSPYSEEVTAVGESNCYIRFTSNAYSYSVRYYNSDDDVLWVDATYHSSVNAGRSNYYYYAFEKRTDYEKMQFFIYSSDMQQGQDEEYLICSELLTRNDSYDTFALSQRGSNVSYQWTNYSTKINDFGGMGGFGGMNDGNTEKGDHSTKGIKADNTITISGGSITIKSYDDCIHANGEETLENGEVSLGNVSVEGGTLSLYSNDDAIHADGTLSVSGGTIDVSHCYEGLEGDRVTIGGGMISILATDDGINATATSGVGIEIAGGKVYVNCSGDGLDSNSRTAYQGIAFSGGDVVIISDSGGNSAIDTEAGYSYSGGSVLAVMPARGMTNEVTHCSNFSSVATKTTMNLRTGDVLTVTVDGEIVADIEATFASTAMVIYLGSNNAQIAKGDAD